MPSAWACRGFFSSASWAPTFIIYEREHFDRDTDEAAHHLLRTAGYHLVDIWPDQFAYRYNHDGKSIIAGLAGFNSNKFDVPMLMEEFIRANLTFSIENRSLIDVHRIYTHFEKRTLEAAYKFYCDKTLLNAHSAEADTPLTPKRPRRTGGGASRDTP